MLEQSTADEPDQAHRGRHEDAFGANASAAPMRSLWWACDGAGRCSRYAGICAQSYEQWLSPNDVRRSSTVSIVDSRVIRLYAHKRCFFGKPA